MKSCALSAGRLDVRAVVTDPEVARRILDALMAATARAPPAAEDDRVFVRDPDCA